MIEKHLKICCLYLCLGVVLAGCFSQQKFKKMVVNQPEINALQTSIVQLPIKMYAKPFLAKASGFITKEITSEGFPKYIQPQCDFRYKYRFVKDTVLFSMSNNYLLANIIGKYQIAGSATICEKGKSVSPWITESCGFGTEKMRGLEIQLGSQIQLLPSWKIKTTSNANSVIPLDPCKIEDNEVDLTEAIMDTIKSNIGNFTKFADEIVENIDLNEALDSNWKKINAPFALPLNYGFLKAQPQQIKIGKFNIVNDTLYASASLAFKPTLYSNKPLDEPTPEVISLETVEQEASKYILHADAIYSFDSLLKVGAPFIYGKEFKLPMKQKISITKITIANANTSGKLKITASFKGTKKGTFTVYGTPFLDEAAQTISLPDLYFEVKSKNMIINVGKSLFKKRIYTELKKATTISLSKYKTMSMLSLNILLNNNKGDVKTSGQVKNIAITGLQTKNNFIYLRLLAEGNANLLIKTK
jgi:hypothetical protein